MKRSLTGILAATMVLGSIVPTAFAKAQAPSDVDSSNQYATAINTLVSSNILNLYADGTFKPDQRLARAQFAAYVYNVVNAAGKITKHYTQPDQPYKDEDKYFRNQLNDMYLYGYLNNLDLGNGDFGLYWMTPAWWAAQLLCNVAGISYDSSSRYDAMNKARDQGWFANTPDEDANPNYYLNRDEMAQILENFTLDQFPDLLKGQAASLTVSAKDKSVQTGTADQLTVSGTDLSGGALDLSNTPVTYSVDKSDTGFVNSKGVFTATAPGTYTVTAAVGSATATTTITVYGQPASLSVTANKDLVADGAAASSSTVTVNVYDSNSNLVSNYNGPVTLTSSNGNDVSFDSTAGSNAKTSATANAVNGVATFTVYTGQAATAGDTATLTASATGASTITGTGSIKLATPQATSFSVGYASGQPNGLAVNNSNAQTAIVVKALDQAGNQLSSYNGWATVSISGPGNLLGSTTTSENVWIGAGQSTPIYVKGQQGVSGNVVVKVSASGFADQSFTIPAYTQTAPSSISLSVDNSTVASGGYSTVTVKELDSNGNLAVINSLGQPNNATLALTQDTGSSSVVVPASVTLVNGQATFTVTNNGFIGTGNLKAVDGLLSSSLPLTFATGSASKIAAVASTVYAPAASTQTVTFQLEDSAGNAVKAAGDTFTLAATNGGTLSANTATTDANGQFTVKVTMPNAADGTQVGVTATGSGNNTSVAAGTENLYVRSALNLATSVTGTVYDPSAGTSVTVPNLNHLNAGQSVYLDVYGLNAVGSPVGKGDSFTVTSSNSNIVSVSTSPITGVDSSTIPSSSADASHVAVLKGLLAGTATITVTDTSVVGAPSYSVNVTVGAGNTPGSLAVQGLTSNSTVAAGQTYAITLQLADAGGNPVFLQQGDQPVTVTLNDGGIYGFRSAANGSTITTATIPAYGNSAVVYWTAPASGSNLSLNFTGSYVNAAGKTVNVSGAVTGLSVK